MQILVRDNNVDQALRALKKKLQREASIASEASASPLKPSESAPRARRRSAGPQVERKRWIATVVRWLFRFLLGLRRVCDRSAYHRRVFVRKNHVLPAVPIADQEGLRRKLDRAHCSLPPSRRSPGSGRPRSGR